MGMKILMIKIQLALIAAGAAIYDYYKYGGRFY
jgi:hypothetical protein